MDIDLHRNYIICSLISNSELNEITNKNTEYFVCIHCSELKSPTTHIIREVYEGQNAHEAFETELEKALEARVNYIIIEPARLSDETERWITVGNCLHQTAVATGLASIASGSLWPDRPAVYASFCAISVFCTGLYTVSWNYDPCCQYQVSASVKCQHILPNNCPLSCVLLNLFKINRLYKVNG